VPVEAGTTNVPEAAPAAAGTNVRPAVQLDDGASVAPQVVELMTYGPVVENVPSVAGTVGDGFAIVKLRIALEAPTVTLPKFVASGVTVTEGGGGIGVPVPERLEETALPLATVSIVPLAGPTATGWKLALALQLVFGARVAPQLLETSAKGPVVVTGASVTGTRDGLVNVKNAFELVVPTWREPKLKLTGEIVVGGGAVPLPDTEELIAPEAVATSIVPVAGPALVGAKRPPTVQEELAASVDPQLPATTWNGPVVVKGPIASDVGAPLVTVKFWKLLNPPTATLPKLNVVGVSVAGGGGTAVPETVTARGLPGALSQM
jgi:hypothetical protein